MLQTSVLNAESVLTDFAASGKTQQSSLGDKGFAAIFDGIQSKLTASSFNAGFNCVGRIADHARTAMTERPGFDEPKTSLYEEDEPQKERDEKTRPGHDDDRRAEAVLWIDQGMMSMQSAQESAAKITDALDPGKSGRSFENAASFEQTLTDEDLNSLKLLDQRQVLGKTAPALQTADVFATDKAVLQSLDGKSSKEFVNELAGKLNVEKLSLEKVQQEPAVKVEAIGQQLKGATVKGETGVLTQEQAVLDTGLKLKESMLKAQINEAKFDDPSGMYNVKTSHRASFSAASSSFMTEQVKAGFAAQGTLQAGQNLELKNSKAPAGLSAIKASLSNQGAQSLGSALQKTVEQALQAQNSSTTVPHVLPGQASARAVLGEESFSLWTQSLAGDLDETLASSLKGAQGNPLLFAPEGSGFKAQGKGLVTTVSELQNYYAQATAVREPSQSAMGQDAGQNMNNEAGSNRSGELASLFAQKFALSSDGASQAAMVNEMVMSMAARNLKRMTIDLNPKVLGRMSIKLTVDDDGALHKVQIGASSDTTRHLIKNSLSTLNQLLSRQGTEVEASIDDDWSLAQA